MSNQTWILVSNQGQDNIIDLKWVLKNKYKACVSIIRRKARLVARGFQQTIGFDFEEKLCSIINASTMRIIFSDAVHLN